MERRDQIQEREKLSPSCLPQPLFIGFIMVLFRFHNTSIFMPTITLKGLPEALYERLKLQAAANRRSLNSEVLVCLEHAVASQGPDAASILARIERMQENLNVQPFNEHELQAAKEHGRQ